MFRELSVAEALVLAVLLAPTDAALGQAVVTDPRLPSRIRQGLNVESGLNDGICVPVLFIVLAAADVESHVAGAHPAITIVAEEIGYGILGGASAGLLVAAAVRIGRRRDLIDEAWLQVIPIAGATLSYGVAAALGGSGFIAAFLAGLLFGALVDESDEAARFTEGAGMLLDGLTFLLFGAVLLGPALEHLSWGIVVYAVLSLTVVRMVPVAIAMLGSGARRQTSAFLGWFGPRGLASIVFAVIVVDESHLPHVQTILLTTYVTIGLSVLAHGLSAAPLAARYARWYRSHPHGLLPSMESGPARTTACVARSRRPLGRIRALGAPNCHRVHTNVAGVSQTHPLGCGEERRLYFGKRGGVHEFAGQLMTADARHGIRQGLCPHVLDEERGDGAPWGQLVAELLDGLSRDSRRARRERPFRRAPPRRDRGGSRAPARSGCRRRHPARRSRTARSSRRHAG